MEALDEVLEELGRIEDVGERSFLQRLLGDLLKDSKAVDRTVEDAMKGGLEGSRPTKGAGGGMLRREGA